MVEQGAASEDDVVLAFLQAEVDSPRWGPCYRSILQERGWDRNNLIDAPNLSDTQANRDRISLLGAVRGYGRGTGLFCSFPGDTKWRRVLVELPDLQRLKYIGEDQDWFRLSSGTRLVQDGARNLETDPRIAARVSQTQQEIEQGRCRAALILVETNSGEIVVLEGNTRATAYAILFDRSFSAFIGTSPLMNVWPFV